MSQLEAQKNARRMPSMLMKTVLGEMKIEANKKEKTAQSIPDFCNLAVAAENVPSLQNNIF